jgi:hypothetical protein
MFANIVRIHMRYSVLDRYFSARFEKHEQLVDGESGIRTIRESDIGTEFAVERCAEVFEHDAAGGSRNQIQNIVSVNNGFHRVPL